MKRRTANEKLWKKVLQLWPEAMEYQDMPSTINRLWGIRI